MGINKNKWRSIVAPIAISGVMAMSAVFAFGGWTASADGEGGGVIPQQLRPIQQ